MSTERRAAVVAAAIVAIWLLCAWDYVRPSTSAGLAQVSVADFSPQLVRAHRVPYVLNELLPSAADLIGSVFKFAYVRAVETRLEAPASLRTSAMYTVITARASAAEVDLRADSASAGETMRVLLQPGRVVVVPPRWSVAVAKGPVDVWQLFDPASACATLLGTMVL